MPQNVWEFRIGGYQVLDKYLKSRKGSMLTWAKSGMLAGQMQSIDTAYRTAFPEHA